MEEEFTAHTNKLANKAVKKLSKLVIKQKIKKIYGLY